MYNLKVLVKQWRRGSNSIMALQNNLQSQNSIMALQNNLQSKLHHGLAK